MYCQISNQLNKISYFNFYKKKKGVISHLLFITIIYGEWRTREILELRV